MQLVDAHCHLEAEAFSDCLPAVLAAASAAGVTRLVTAATRPDQWARSRAIAVAHPQVAFALGVHPWFADTAYLPAIEAMDTSGAAAIGEIGLDGAIEAPAMETQLTVFEAQLALARERELPVVIHCRRAFDALLPALRRVGELPRGGVVHAFSGSADVAELLLPRGFVFSLGRSLTYRPSRKREAVLRRIYPDAMLLETDSPDMPPAGVDPPNGPKNLRLVLAGAAALLGAAEADIAAATTANAARIFGWAP